MQRTIIFGQSICWISICIIGFLSSKHAVHNAIIEQGNFINNLNRGLKIASDLLGISTAEDVANLGTKAFSTNLSTNRYQINSNEQSDAKPNIQITPFQSNNNNNNTTTNRKYLEESEQQGDVLNKNAFWNNNNLNPKFITNILRLVGFDIKKMGDLAVHIIIIIVQAVSKGIISTNTNTNTTKGNTSEEMTNGRRLESDKTFSWLFRHPSLNTHRLLDQVMDGTLSDKVIAMIANYEQHIGQTACLQLLICKCTPFIRGMQQSLTKWLVVKGDNHHNAFEANNQPTNTSSPHAYNVFDNFKFPSLVVYRQHEKQCESNYTKYCNMSLSNAHNI